jgi:hypothetical protein
MSVRSFRLVAQKAPASERKMPPVAVSPPAPPHSPTEARLDVQYKLLP